MAAPNAVHAAIDYTLRQDRGRLIAALTAVIGGFELAEECLQEACVAALTDWPKNGIPKSRRGWLLQVGRRRALDQFRRAKVHANHAAQIAVLEHAEANFPVDSHDIPDHRLRLIFTCCHPALDEKTRVALTLRSLGGLTTDEVARAFLDKPTTMGQRLARARRKISKAGIGFEIPDGPDLHSRVASVLSVIYLIFNEGYAVTKGAAPIRIDLCVEAIFLARLMHDLSPETPETGGLLALLLLTHARHGARYEAGNYIPLAQQNRSLWDQKRILEGQKTLEGALMCGQVGPYQLQASIAALHCEAVTSDATDWPQITALYRMLARMEPGAIVVLNLAVALSFSEGAAKALDLLGPIENELQSYQSFHAARADLLRRLGRDDDAMVAYQRALDLTQNQSEVAFLQGRLDEIAKT